MLKHGGSAWSGGHVLRISIRASMLKHGVSAWIGGSYARSVPHFYRFAQHALLAIGEYGFYVIHVFIPHV